LDTQTAITESARKLFCQFGFDGVGMAHIAQEAGKNKATLYHYYKSKQELYNAVLKETIDYFLRHTALKLQAAPIEELHLYIDALFSFELTSLSLIMRELSSQKKDCDKANAQLLEGLDKEFVKLYTYGVGRGVFKLLEPTPLFDMLVGAIMLYRMGAHTKAPSIKLYKEHLATHLLEIIQH